MILTERMERKGLYTTGMVAKLLNVAPRTVTKWIDRGILKGYKIPGGLDRRVTRKELERFCRDHNLPVSPAITYGVLFVGIGGTAEADWRERLPDLAGFRLSFAWTAFEAGVRFAQESPDCVVVDCTVLGRVEASLIARSAQGAMSLALHAGEDVPTGFQGPCAIDRIRTAAARKLGTE